MVEKEKIEEIFDNIFKLSVKCSTGGSKPGSGVIYGEGESPRFELNDGGLNKELLNSIADTMAERWGLEVSVDEKGKREIGMNKFKLWDNRHNTIINLGKIIKHQDWIDFTNNGKGNYNLDDVLRYYDELDDLAKTRMGGVFFETRNGASFNRVYNNRYGVSNTIEISNMVYGSNQGTNIPSEYHLKQVMGHEAGHSMERIISQKEVDVLRKAGVKGKQKFNRNQLDTDEEKKLYDDLILQISGDANDISSSKEWRDAQNKNKVTISSKYAASYKNYSDRNSEDFAETMSAVAYRNSNDKKNFRMRYEDGRVVGYDEFVSDHQSTFKLACDYADGKIVHTDLHNRFTGEKFT